MAHASPRRRTLRRTATAVGAVAVIALGAAPAGAADPDTGLVMGKIGPIDGVKPGSEVGLPGSFTNTGTEALDKVWMIWSATIGLGYSSPTPSNCSTENYGGADEAPQSYLLICEFDQTVSPGVVYAPEGPKLRIQDSALNDELTARVSKSPIQIPEGSPTQGTGPAIKLVERPDETPAAPGSTEPARAGTKVTAKSTADFQVTGAQLKGKVGDTVPLTVKFTNAGPGWVAGEPYESVTNVHIKMPAGTTVTGTHSCRDQGQGAYVCGTSSSFMHPNTEHTYKFKLKINKAVPGAKGSVALEEKSRPFDPIKSNDSADILLDVEGAGATGGSGSTSGTGGSGTSGSDSSGSTSGSGGSGTSASGGSGSASGSGSTSGSGTSTTGGSSATGTSGSSSTGGDLAETGSGSTLPLAAAAAGAVILGAGGVLVARRRAARQR
ncbi:hypothetical protein [Streptomyces sp. NBC_01013]|uniref:hypothetical protein n=1 Tax=Streptomyces sp. NBC_01013 TaxID=2903718 RepID=UPI003864A8F0|nr:hypothetical protein OG538_12990 [Streptomyces sp. NBC_01013]